MAGRAGIVRKTVQTVRSKQARGVIGTRAKKNLTNEMKSDRARVTGAGRSTKKVVGRTATTLRSKQGRAAGRSAIGESSRLVRGRAAAAVTSVPGATKRARQALGSKQGRAAAGAHYKESARNTAGRTVNMAARNKIKTTGAAAGGAYGVNKKRKK